MGNNKTLSLYIDINPDIDKVSFQVGFLSLAKGKWYEWEGKSRQIKGRCIGESVTVLETSS